MFKHWIISMVLAALLAACQSVSLQQPRESSWLVRPQLGVRLKVISSDGLPAELAFERRHVLRVVKIYPGLPAQRAGVLLGDTLLWLDGAPVSGMRDSVAIMETKHWGDTVVLTVLRDGALQAFDVALTKEDGPEGAPTVHDEAEY